MLLLPIRTIIIPRMSFTREELAILDGPTASAFVSKYPSFVMYHSSSIIILDYGICRRWRFLNNYSINVTGLQTGLKEQVSLANIYSKLRVEVGELLHYA